MRKTSNYGLVLYDLDDKMRITSEEDSLNATMEIIDIALAEKTTMEEVETHTSNLASEIENNVKEDIQPVINDVVSTSENALEAAETAESIARGKSASVVFETFEEAEVWLKDVANKGVHSVGDNLYIKQMWIDEEAGIRQPDYWITEVLEEPNELGYYYEISDLGVEHPDLTNLISKDETKEKYLLITYEDETTETIKLVVYK